MAERTINWSALRNQGVYGMPAPFELRDIPEKIKNAWKHPYATKVREGVSNAASAWWQNVNPARWGEKDRYWVAGVGVGALESAAAVFLMPIGGGLVKGGVNFVATQLAFAGAREIDARYNTNVGDRTKSFVKGMAAGAAYFSPLSGITRQLTDTETFRSAVGQVHIPDVTQAPEAIKTGVGDTFSKIGTFVHEKTGLGLDNTSPSPAVVEPTVSSPVVQPSVEPAVSPVAPAVEPPVTATPVPEASQPDVTPPEASAPVQAPVVPPVEHSTPAPVTPPVDHGPVQTNPVETPPVKGGAPSVEPAKPPVEAPVTSAAPPAHQPDTAPATPPAVATNPSVPLTDKIGQIQNDAGFKTSLSADVGEKLPMADQIIADTLARQGKRIADLSPQALEAARKAVQHAMENQVNISGHDALDQILTDNPNLDVHSEAVIAAAKKATKEGYDQWLASADHQHTLADIAQKTIQEQIDTQKVVAQFSAKAITNFVTENQGNSELVMEHVVKSGENAGQMLHDLGGFSIGWDMSDVSAFASLKVLNPTAFSDLAHLLNLDQDKLEALIQRATTGDREAYRQLIESLHLIRTGTTIKMLTKKGLSSLLASVK